MDFTQTRIGILGGGQLGRMILQSSVDHNLNISILDPDEHAPCRYLTHRFVQGSLTDFETVYNFGKSCDLITIEIENVNVEALNTLLEEGKQVYPQPAVIELIQNKVHQKQFYEKNNLPTSPFRVVASHADVLENRDWIPFVNKLATEGYDGRGVHVVHTEKDLDAAFDKAGLIEKFVDFETEISVIVARNQSGDTVAYPPVELAFHPTANLVEFLYAPATIDAAIGQEARSLAKKVITELEMVGLLAVEMFVTKSGEVLINEIAPRPHNSGHQTIEGNVTSQFEQHLRSILNLPLGATDTVIPTAMVNLLGEDGYAGNAVYEGMEEVMAISGVHVHLYGKKLTKPFRKMGHVTIADHDLIKLREKANFVKKTLKVIA